MSFTKCLIVFFVSLLLRLTIILCTDNTYENIDLAIYRDTGELISWRINPYNFNDSPELRERFRTDGAHWNDCTSKSQEAWNYFASSNLPLSAIFFGVIEHYFHSGVAYRIVFAVMDSLLGVLVLLFVFNIWKFNKGVQLPVRVSPNALFAVGLLLVALSPTLIYWGVVWPEHKGTGTLLILSAVYFSYSNNRFLRIGVSGVLLGCSVAFIGLGVFVAPLCLYNVYRRNPQDFKIAFVYSCIAFFSCFIWFLPFTEGLLSMMSGRMSNVLKASHASLWWVVSKGLPDQWMMVRKLVLVLFLALIGLGVVLKRIGIGVATASLLLWFVSIYLTNGSLDRVNIGLVCLIVILGCEGFATEAILLTCFSFVYGAFYLSYYLLVGHTEIFDTIYTFLFTLVYVIFISRLVFIKKLQPAVKQ